MFRLYGNIEGWKFIRSHEDEFKIISTLGNYIKKYDEVHYIIIKNENNGDIPHRLILTKQDYYNYLEDYKDEVKNKYIVKSKKM